MTAEPFNPQRDTDLMAVLRAESELRPSALPSEARVITLDHLALALGGSGDSFTGWLLLLIGKADRVNRARLQQAFPLHVAAWELWQHELTVGELREALGQ